MSPNGVFDRRAQIRSPGSLPLYMTNQGRIEKGAAINEQLAAMDIATGRASYPQDISIRPVMIYRQSCPI